MSSPRFSILVNIQEKEKELPGNKEYAEEKKKKDYKMERYFKQYLGETAQSI